MVKFVGRMCPYDYFIGHFSDGHRFDATFNALLVVIAAGFVHRPSRAKHKRDRWCYWGGFRKNRYMSLFALVLPVIGIMERHGLANGQKY